MTEPEGPEMKDKSLASPPEKWARGSMDMPAIAVGWDVRGGDASTPI